MEKLLNPSALIYGLCILGIGAFGVFVIRGYIKQLRQGCCGSAGGERLRKNRVRDRDASHYPYRAKITIDGMVCDNCAARVANALNALGGVWATVDVNQSCALVRMKRPLSPAELRNAVNAIGPYTVMALEEMRA